MPFEVFGLKILYRSNTTSEVVASAKSGQHPLKKRRRSLEINLRFKEKGEPA